MQPKGSIEFIRDFHSVRVIVWDETHNNAMVVKMTPEDLYKALKKAKLIG